MFLQEAKLGSIADDAFATLNRMSARGRQQKPRFRRDVQLFSKHKEYRHSGVAEVDNDKLAQLPEAELVSLLSKQERLSKSGILKNLPDGGAKVFAKIKTIQEVLALVRRTNQDANDLHMSLDKLQINDTTKLQINDTTMAQVSAVPRAAKGARVERSAGEQTDEFKEGNTQIKMVTPRIGVDQINRTIAARGKADDQARLRVRPPPTFVSMEEYASVRLESRSAWSALKSGMVTAAGLDPSQYHTEESYRDTNLDDVFGDEGDEEQGEEYVDDDENEFGAGVPVGDSAGS